MPTLLVVACATRRRSTSTWPGLQCETATGHGFRIYLVLDWHEPETSSLLHRRHHHDEGSPSGEVLQEPIAQPSDVKDSRSAPVRQPGDGSSSAGRDRSRCQSTAPGESSAWEPGLAAPLLPSMAHVGLRRAPDLWPVSMPRPRAGHAAQLRRSVRLPAIVPAQRPSRGRPRC
jgi:hypothetical protein